jgi:hypothetical protein
MHVRWLHHRSERDRIHGTNRAVPRLRFENHNVPEFKGQKYSSFLPTIVCPTEPGADIVKLTARWMQRQAFSTFDTSIWCLLISASNELSDKLPAIVPQSALLFSTCLVGTLRNDACFNFLEADRRG